MAMRLLTLKEFKQSFGYGSGIGVIAYLIWLVLNLPMLSQAITVPFSTYATTVRGSANVVGASILDIIKLQLPLQSTFIPALITLILGFGVIAVVGKQAKILGLPSGKTQFTKVFLLLLYGSVVAGFVINGFRGEGLLAAMITLVASALILTWVATSKIVTKNTPLKAVA